MASPDYSDGCMIALYPPQQLAEDLAVPDGLDSADMHVTVAYLGDTADVDRDKLLAAAQALAARKPAEAVISGHARFTGGKQDVIVALVDSPDLEDLRGDVLAALDERDVALPREHGYTPHLTITYIDRDAPSPVERLDSRPVAFSAVSAVYGTERTNFPFLAAETAPARTATENATIRLGNPQGVWRPIYTRRQALHATADHTILTAWKKDAAGLDLADAVAAWHQAIGENRQPADQHRRDTAAAAVLAVLTARSWKRTRDALAATAQHAHRAGWDAGHHLTTHHRDDDTSYATSAYSVGARDMSDHNAAGTATAALTAALAATARRAGRTMATSSSPQTDSEDTVDAGDDLLLSADVTVSAAYGAGLLAAYLNAGVSAVEWITAGDERVCDACLANEAGNPYSLYGAPRLPAHPRCRCVLAPV